MANWLTIHMPNEPGLMSYDFEILELGGAVATCFRRPGSDIFEPLPTLDKLWDQADDDREEFRLSGPVSFRIGKDPVTSLGEGGLQLGFQEGQPVGLLLDGRRRTAAEYSHGRWRWPGGKASSKVIEIGLAACLLGESESPPIAAPGILSRPSGLAERRFSRT